MRFVPILSISSERWGVVRSLGLATLTPLLLFTAFVPVGVYGQSVASESPGVEVADAIRRVQENDLGTGYVDAMSYVNIIADAQAMEALPVLERFYARTTDPELRPWIASALVRMGDEDDQYWMYLVKLGTPAAESDAPYPLNVLAAKADNEIIAPEFKAWASARNLSVEEATNLVMMDLPRGLAPLAHTGDPRGVPLLRKALTSRNFIIASLAAAGLAQARDKGSIPMIIDACKKAPPNLANFFADSLLFFDDPDAQSTFAHYFPGVNIQEARKFHRNSPFGHVVARR
jgi:HEAT repeat protein